MTIFKISIEPDQVAPSWAVYLVRDALDKVQYIGTCRLTQVLIMPDARANPFWQATFPAGRPLILELIETHHNRPRALNAMHEWMMRNGRPFMNSQPRSTGKAKPIMCEQTGEIFNTMTESVNAHGLTQNALSKHLNHKPGHQTVQGKTYRRIPNPVPSHAPIPQNPLYVQTVAVRPDNQEQ